ncbi:MAG: choice-of-anchor Q domain-containing protein [Verrucomicrobiota bacterium]
MKRIRALLLVLALCGTMSADAAIRYVSSQTGVDTGPATDPAAPCATIQYAVDQSSGGDEIRIATYDVTGFPIPVTNTCAYTGSGANVIELTNAISLTLKGGYVYQHTVVTNWFAGVVPPTVNGQGARRGLYIAGSDGTTNVVELIEFANGSAATGANVFAQGGSAVFIGTPIHHGTASSKGGGIYLSGIDLSMSIGSYSNLALPQLNGMLPVYSNTAAQGGGIYIASGYPVLSTLGLYANGAGLDGGGAFIDGGYPSIVGGAVMENRAGNRGGAFYMTSSVSRIAGMNIASNAAGEGGAFYMNGPFALTMETATLVANNYVRHNRATNGPGGGFYFRKANVGVVNNVIANNSATQGAAAYLYGSSSRFLQNTIADNAGPSGIRVTHETGAGYCVTNIFQLFGMFGIPIGAQTNVVCFDGIPLPSWPSFTNNIITGHATALLVDSTGQSPPFENNVTMGYTVWWTNAADTAGAGTVQRQNDIVTNPLFTCTGTPPGCTLPYHLETNSPAVDAGTLVGLSLPGTDLILDIDGQLRPSGDGMDIGADEVVPLNSYSAWFVPAGYDLTVRPGDVVTNEHYLLNSGDLDDAFTIGTSNLLPWTSSVAPTSVVMVAQTYTTVTVVITVPGGAAHGQTNRTTVTAVSTNDTNRVAYARDLSTVTTNAHEPMTRYVWQESLNPSLPYTSWETAGHDIQTVADASGGGDVIRVHDGVYNTGGRPDPDGGLTNRVYVTNSITIQSENGPENAYVTGQADASATNGPAAIRCVFLAANSVLSGFTLTGGHTGSDPAEVTGGGAELHNAATLRNCVIRGNLAHSYGGGACLQSGGTVENCLVLDNAVVGAGGAGGGVSLQSGGTVNHCTISRNYAYSGGGVGCSSGGDLWNTVIYSNSAYSDPDHYDDGTGMSYAYCCLTPTSGTPAYTSCITNAPGFIGAGTANYRLPYGSPCIDAGTNLATIASDLDGNARPLDGNWDGTNTADMGCYEYDGDSADSDGDTMPDGWEHGYGLNPTNPADASQHADADTIPNVDEWNADTIPTDSDSYLRFLSFSQQGAAVLATYKGGTQAWRVIEETYDLTGGNWWALATSAPPTSVTGSFGIGASSPGAFFRVRAFR